MTLKTGFSCNSQLTVSGSRQVFTGDIVTSGPTQERQSFRRKKTWLLSYMHYDVWWLYHFRRENSFRTFYRRFSGLIFGTRNNSVRWLLIFGCAQDDTQRVEQEGVCACTRVPRCDRAICKFFGCQVFRNPRCTRATPTYALLRRRMKNSVFWQTPKKSSS